MMTQKDVNQFVESVVGTAINDSIGIIKYNLDNQWMIEDFGNLYHDKDASYLSGYVTIDCVEYDFEIGREDQRGDCVEY